MKIVCLFFCLFFLLISCQNSTPENNSIVVDKDSVVSTKSDIETTSQDVAAKPLLALTSNALQLVDSNTGSTREIPFEMPEGQMVDMLTNVLGELPNSIQVNEECGAGSLKMASWNNGLTIVFQEEQESQWIFAGWFAEAPSNSAQKITTMAGIGIGSTRAEMEDVYEIEVYESTLGQEFSTTSGLHGIFDGTSKNAKIEHMWSGLSCNFR
ncbi:MAG: hypothetical protein H0X63_11515 [Flavobacteriales bacterium]|nr:hypothetical protein [Flavobacteriales bacterium]